MNKPGGDSGTYGYLALVQLLASAAVDDRLTGGQRRAITVLARYAGDDGTCCVSMARLADTLGCTRQAVQDALRTSPTPYIALHKPDRARAIKALSGYLNADERQRKTGADGAKVFHFNLTLRGADACPLPRAQGGQAPGLAGGGKLQDLQGGQAPGLAHKKPSEETNYEETNAFPSGACDGERRPRVEGGGGLHGGPSRRQRHLLLPINGKAAQAPPGAAVRQRVDGHNLDATRKASGRLWSEWTRLDPALDLFGRLGAGGAKVAEAAEGIEVKRPGDGVKYLAGAVARASGDSVTAAAILRRDYARRAAAP